MPTDRFFAFALRTPEGATGEGEIDFLHFATLELMGQGFVCGIGFCDNDESAGVFVEAMDDAEPFGAAAFGELISAVMQQRVDERAGGMARCGMNNESGRFIDDEKGLILGDNIEGNVFRFQRGQADERGVVDEKSVGGTELVAGLEPFRIGEKLDTTGLEQCLDLATGMPEHFSEEDIKPLAAMFVEIGAGKFFHGGSGWRKGRFYQGITKSGKGKDMGGLIIRRYEAATR